MPEREREICARLRLFRESTKLSRATFAKEIGMDPIRYASYELGRAPVRFELSKLIKERFGLNLAWLAGEAENTRGNWDVPTWTHAENMLFSTAFDLYIRNAINTYMTKFDGPAIEEIATLTQTSGGLISMGELIRIFDKYKHRWPEDYWNSLLLDYVRRAAEIALALQRGALTSSKPIVDRAAATDTIARVSSDIPTWKQMVAALKRLTNSPGSKAQLAADLKTSRQNVNKWLSGAGAPSAELTLEVFRWVEDHGGWKTKKL